MEEGEPGKKTQLPKTLPQDPVQQVWGQPWDLILKPGWSSPEGSGAEVHSGRMQEGGYGLSCPHEEDSWFW